jgi:hypothetical protein
MANGVKGDLTCNGTWQYYAAPRIAAGGPLSQDVMKCQLKPLTRSDYGPIAFTDAQWSQLQATFATGVCDYSKPGVSQQKPKARWLSFEAGPGGQPLGDPPVSQGPTELLGELAALLESFDLHRQNLDGELGQINTALANGQLARTCDGLEDFASKARKESPRSITPAQAEALAAGAAKIEPLLGC